MATRDASSVGTCAPAGGLSKSNFARASSNAIHPGSPATAPSNVAAQMRAWRARRETGICVCVVPRSARTLEVKSAPSMTSSGLLRGSAWEAAASAGAGCGVCSRTPPLGPGTTSPTWRGRKGVDCRHLLHVVMPIRRMPPQAAPVHTARSSARSRFTACASNVAPAWVVVKWRINPGP
eukprot:7301902-Lingulodinium_polyedra.AAC.1